MTQPSYELLICPVCGSQVEPDYEEGRTCFHEDYGGYIEPVEVDAVPDAEQLRSRQALARFRLQEDRREAAFKLAERRWFWRGWMQLSRISTERSAHDGGKALARPARL